jgi:uncharacterized protein YbjT (DUF2867 family)
MFAIAGVSGNTGSVVADTLLSQGKLVRVIVRDPAKGAPWKARGAEVAVADLGDTAALARAFAGASAAFVLLPPDLHSNTPLEDHRARAEAIAQAVRTTRLPHVVLLSSIGAHLAAGTGPILALHAGESILAATGAALTAIRAASFMENWKTALAALPHGFLPTFVPPDLAYPHVATRDIGRTAAAALLEPGAGIRAIELAGPRDYAANDIAAAVSAIVGKPIAPKHLPLDAVVPTYTGYGISEPIARLFREMYEGITAGHIVADPRSARAVRGTVTITDVLRPAIAAT